MSTPSRALLLSSTALIFACGHPQTDEAQGPAAPEAAADTREAGEVPAPALASIRAEDIARHVEILASDEFEGRFPGSAGEAKTLSYLSGELARLGVGPAQPRGYLQPVPLRSTTVAPASTITARGAKAEALALGHGVDCLIGAGGESDELHVEASELVFAGYGIVAPEQGWDDYAGVDLRGKTVLVLPGDPGSTRPEDPDFFKGLALTHHGTFKAKAALAEERGAAAILSIHDGEATGLAWELIAANGRQSHMQLRDPAGEDGAGFVKGAVPKAKAAALVALDPEAPSLAELTAAAAQTTHRARPLAVELDFELERSSEPLDSHNLVAWIPGRSRADEYVIYTAHWDHIGLAPDPSGEAAGGDRVFNGAVDNATGTAALLELAEAYAALPRAPERSIVFLATTAEEQGLLGAFHYAAHPIFPLADTVAVINMDALFPFGATKGMTVVALGSSELEEYMAEAAAHVDRRLYPDPAPQLGAFFRSDHYPFAARGVPAIFAVGGPAMDPAAGETVDLSRYEDFLRRRYHQVGDEYDPERWDLAGIVQDVEIYFRTGLAVANDARVPNWYPDSEFRPLRDAMLDER